MPTIRYHKLVRDKIPEIIARDGSRCTTETLPDDSYIAHLEEKLREELDEYMESKSLEELADLAEVIRAVIKARGSSLAAFEAMRRDKCAARGAFDKRLLLLEVIKPD